MNATELTVLPVNKDNSHVLKNYVTEEDPTVINLREGDALQTFNVGVADEFGGVLPCGDFPGMPIDLYANFLISSGLYTPATLPFNLSDSYHARIGDFKTLYNNDLTTSLLKDEGGFLRSNNFLDAKIDSSTPITHYMSMIMF